MRICPVAELQKRGDFCEASVRVSFQTRTDAPVLGAILGGFA